MNATILPISWFRQRVGTPSDARSSTRPAPWADITNRLDAIHTRADRALEDSRELERAIRAMTTADLESFLGEDIDLTLANRWLNQEDQL